MKLCVSSGSPCGGFWEEFRKHDHPAAEPDDDGRTEGVCEKYCVFIFVGIRISEEVLMTFYNLKYIHMRKTA